MEENGSIHRRGVSLPPTHQTIDTLSQVEKNTEIAISEAEESLHHTDSSLPMSKKPFFPRKIMLAILGFGIFCLLGAGILSYYIASRPPAPVTLTYWGTTMTTASMTPIIDAFHKKYPYITITYSQEDINGYQDRLVARVPAGTGPDMYEYHVSWLPMMKNILLPLNPSISADDIRGHYYPVVSNDLVKNATVYGIPFGIDTLSLFVNQNILQASGLSVPSTWKDFSDTAYALTVKDTNRKIKIAGAALGTYANISYAPDIISALLIQNGADPLTVGQNPQATLDTLTFYTSFAKADTAIWDDTLDISKNAFAKGTLAMYLGYTQDISDLKNLNPALSFSVHQLPHVPGRHIATVSYWAEGISSQTRNSKAALLFMEYLNQKDTQAALYASQVQNQPTPYAPAQTALATLVAKDPGLSVVSSQLPSSVSSIFVGETGDSSGIDAQLNGYLQNTLILQSTNGMNTESISVLSDGIAKVLTQYK